LKLEFVAPKIRGSLEQMLASLPSMEPQAVIPPISNAHVVTTQPALEATTTVSPISTASPLQPTEEK